MAPKVYGSRRNSKKLVNSLTTTYLKWQGSDLLTFLTSTSASLTTLKPFGVDCVYYEQVWKILKETGVPDHLTSLLRNPYTAQEATVTTRHGTMKVKVLTTQSCPALCNQMDGTQAPLSMGFSRQDTGVGYHSLLLGIFLT